MVEALALEDQKVSKEMELSPLRPRRIGSSNLCTIINSAPTTLPPRTVMDFAEAVARDANLWRRDVPAEPVAPERALNPGQLATQILDWHAWGLISTPMVQTIAAAGVSDGVTDPWLADLAAIGTSGQHVQNLRRDLERVVNRALRVHLPEPDRIMVPFKEAFTENLVWQEHSIILPHLLFHTLQQNYPEFFDMLIAAGHPITFWATAPEGEPRLQRHAVKEVPDYDAKAVPLVVHGYGAQYTTHGDSIKCLQWSVLGSELSVSGPSWNHVFLITAVVGRAAAKQQEQGADTWDVIYTHVVASFRTLMLGVFPQTDPFGAAWPEESLHAALAAGVDGDLADGDWVGFLYAVSADLDFACNELGARHYNSVQCCWLCDARQADGPLNCKVGCT